MGLGVETYDTLSGLMFYSFNMPLFFFVSGFLAHKAPHCSGVDLAKKVWQKFIYLVIPAVVYYVFLHLKEHANPLELFTRGAGGYWFTITLFECFVVYFFVICSLKNSKLQNVVLIGLAIAGIAFLSAVGECGPELLDLNRLAKYFQFFVIGIMAMKYSDCYEKIMHNDKLKALALLGFFTLLFIINYDVWPSAVFHLMRDIVLRYLGTFIVVSWFVCHDDWFNANTKVNQILLDIGRKSLAIYLLQYFFIPDFKVYTKWLGDMDGVMMHMISFACTAIILAVCYIFISVLSNSLIIKKYILGQK